MENVIVQHTATLISGHQPHLPLLPSSCSPPFSYPIEEISPSQSQPAATRLITMLYPTHAQATTPSSPSIHPNIKLTPHPSTELRTLTLFIHHITIPSHQYTSTNILTPTYSHQHTRQHPRTTIIAHQSLPSTSKFTNHSIVAFDT